MTPPRRIAVLIHSLSGGGAERVTALLVNHWAERVGSVSLITLDSAAADAYPVSDRVRRIGLGLLRHSATPAHALWNNCQRVRRLRQVIERAAPDVLVSHCVEMNVLALLACRRPKTPVFITEHSNLLCHRPGRIWAWLRSRTYPRCAGLVVLTEASRRPGARLVRGRPVLVIPNAVVPPKGAADRGSLVGPEPARPRIVSMGRLAPEKGFDLLIRAFAQIAPRHPQWDLRILGEGPQRPALEGLRRQLGLADRVQLPGWVDSPERELAQAAFYVLASRYEGSPLALQEAMACGLAAVSFDCPTGPREVVRHGVDGLLVPPEDVPRLAEAIDRLIRDPQLRSRLAVRASDVTRRFSLESFYHRWDAALGLEPAG